MSEPGGGLEKTSPVVIMVELVKALVNMLAFFHTCVVLDQAVR